MSLVLENSSDLIDLGDAIRSKTGGSSNLTVAQMATAVDGLTIATNKTWHCEDIYRETNTIYKSYSYDLSSYIDSSNELNYVLMFYVKDANNSSYFYRVAFAPMFAQWVNVMGYGSTYPNRKFIGSNWSNYMTISNSDTQETRMGSLLNGFRDTVTSSSWITTTYSNYKLTFTTTMANSDHLVSYKAKLLYLA